MTGTSTIDFFNLFFRFLGFGGDELARWPRCLSAVIGRSELIYIQTLGPRRCALQHSLNVPRAQPKRLRISDCRRTSGVEGVEIDGEIEPLADLEICQIHIIVVIVTFEVVRCAANGIGSLS
jgi:hypothetical protein